MHTSVVGQGKSNTWKYHPLTGHPHDSRTETAQLDHHVCLDRLHSNEKTNKGKG